jgi:hypothetical protein
MYTGTWQGQQRLHLSDRTMCVYLPGRRVESAYVHSVLHLAGTSGVYACLGYTVHSDLCRNRANLTHFLWMNLNDGPGSRPLETHRRREYSACFLVLSDTTAGRHRCV